MKKALITGIHGQDGSYLAKFLLEKGYNIKGVLRENELKNLFRHNYLNIKDKIHYSTVNLLNEKEVELLIKDYQPDEIYNLAAISSVGISFEYPEKTINNNNKIIMNILKSLRKINKDLKLYQAASSEMYGNPPELPVTLNTPLKPISPYGISKSFGYRAVNKYRNLYNIFAVNGILFNHESFLRDEKYFVKKLIKQSLEIKDRKREKLFLGNLNVKRDFGYSPDYIKSMWKMLQNREPKNYIVCSGESISLENIVDYVLKKLNLKKNVVEIKKSLYRPAEIKNVYGDNTKAKTELGWKYNKSFYDILDILIEEERKYLK